MRFKKGQQVVCIYNDKWRRTIAFSDPMLLVGKAAKARAKAKETWHDTGKKTRAKKSERSDYHRKHG